MLPEFEGSELCLVNSPDQFHEREIILLSDHAFRKIHLHYLEIFEIFQKKYKIIIKYTKKLVSKLVSSLPKIIV